MEADGPCVAVHGPSSIPGHLYLTTQRVCFEPTVAPRAPGVGAWAVDIPSIRSARMLGTGATLLLDVADGQRQMDGPGARVVHDRLIQLISATEPSAPVVDERVLLRATALVEVNDLLSASGELTVTNLRIRFSLGLLENAVGLGVAFDDPIANITGFGFTGVRNRLEVHISGRMLRFSGNVVPALYGALQCCAEGKAVDVPGEVLTYNVMPASLCRGPLSHPGALVGTGTRLAFVATGMLDSLVGVPSLTEIPVAAISSIRRVGAKKSRIQITTPDGNTTYASGDVNHDYERLVVWLAARVAGPIWLGAGADPVPPEVETCLASFQRSQALPDGLQFFTPAVGLTPNSPATPGFLVVGDDTMVWLPGRAPNPATPRILLRLGCEHWVWSNELDEVQVERRGTIFRWLTRSGEPFRRALFERVERIKQEIALAWSSSGTGVVSVKQNRRNSYRVSVSRQAQPAIWRIMAAADGEFRPLSCDLFNLSLGGCSIRTQHQPPADSELRVDLTQAGRLYTAQVTVVFARQDLKGKDWIAGLVFVQTSHDFDNVWRQCWMTLQQEQIIKLRGEPPDLWQF